MASKKVLRQGSDTKTENRTATLTKLWKNFSLETTKYQNFVF